jgi:general secretion pathway protein B
MSFILDALKKSESDRQRQTGPALFEVKIAPPKARFPVWAAAIAALLGINMIIVGWLLLRRPAHQDAPQAAIPTQNNTAPMAHAQQPAAPAQMPPMNVPATPLPTAPATTPNMSQAQWTSAPIQQQSGPPVQNSGPPPQSGTTQGSGMTDVHEPTLADNTRDSNGSANGARDPATNPEDYAPAAEPNGTPLFKGHVQRGTESGVPLYQDAAVVPGSNIPGLRLDLHVYAANPRERFALINMHKLHEGDSTPDGVRVESITPDGVIMSHNGSKFLLPRD